MSLYQEPRSRPKESFHLAPTIGKGAHPYLDRPSQLRPVVLSLLEHLALFVHVADAVVDPRPSP